MNASAVTAQVNHIKSRPNLLVWYTADEPDGTSDPLDATLKASNLVTKAMGREEQSTILSLSFSTAKITISRMFLVCQ